MSEENIFVGLLSLADRTGKEQSDNLKKPNNLIILTVDLVLAFLGLLQSF